MKRTIFLLLILILGFARAWRVGADVRYLAVEGGMSSVTVAKAGASSAWYGALMPVFGVILRFPGPQGGESTVSSSFRLSYKESDSFSVNSLLLAPGELHSTVVSLEAEHLWYRGTTFPLSFVLGGSAAGAYREFTQVVTAGGNMGTRSLAIAFGPVLGLAFSVGKGLAALSLASFSAGLPLYGSVFYPDGFSRSVSTYGLGLSLRNRLTVTLFRVPVELEYRYDAEISVSFDSAPVNAIPRDVEVNHVHSFGMRFGVVF